MSDRQDEYLAMKYKVDPIFRSFTDNVSSVFLYRNAQNVLGSVSNPSHVDVRDVLFHLKENEKTARYVDKLFDAAVNLLLFEGRLSTHDCLKGHIIYVDERKYNIKKSIKTLKSQDNKY
jgi:hypothetical protein